MNPDVIRLNKNPILKGDPVGLGSNANVYETCLRILRQQGFDLHVEGELDADGMFPVDKMWYATIGEISLYADNPIELLGFCLLYTSDAADE